MDRRSFNKKFLLVGLAAPSILSRFSAPALGHVGNDSNRLEPEGRVTLRLPGTSRNINYFAIQTNNGLIGVDLRMEVPQMAAERFDLGNVPLLGQILTPTLQRQFSGATVAGKLFLVDDTMVLLPEIDIPARRTRVWITHRNLVYRPPASIRRLAVDITQTQEQVESSLPIGKAVVKDNIVLAIVPPSVVDDMEFERPASV